MPLIDSVDSFSLRALFRNPIFLSSILSLFIAQGLKAVFYVLGRRRRKTREFFEIISWRTGGMPSSHAAVVCSLCTSIGYVEGMTSNLFVFSFWFALVVLRDAMGVRRSAGLVARALNHLGKQAAEKSGVDFNPVKEVQGHTPLEVFVGGFLGVFIGVGIHFLNI